MESICGIDHGGSIENSQVFIDEVHVRSGDVLQPQAVLEHKILSVFVSTGSDLPREVGLLAVGGEDTAPESQFLTKRPRARRQKLVHLAVRGAARTSVVHRFCHRFSYLTAMRPLSKPSRTERFA